MHEIRSVTHVYHSELWSIFMAVSNENQNSAGGGLAFTHHISSLYGQFILCVSLDAGQQMLKKNLKRKAAFVSVTYFCLVLSPSAGLFHSLS